MEQKLHVPNKGITACLKKQLHGEDTFEQLQLNREKRKEKNLKPKKVVLKITVLMISITRNRTCPNAYELTQVNLTGHR